MTEPQLNPPYDLVVSLGTDHHRFDRLVAWVETYLEANPQVTALIQHGFTAPPRLADGVERLPRQQLLELYQQASVVLVQGGPGSILDAREVGALPLSVPRLSRLKEAVDDHQVEFARIMEIHGETMVVSSSEDLANKLDAALADPDSLKGSYRVPGSDKAAQRLQGLVESALGGPWEGRLSGVFLRRIGQVFRWKA